MEEDEVKQPSEDILERDGKLVVEYKGGRYTLKGNENGFYGFHGPDEEIEHELNLAYSRVKGGELLDVEMNGGYWYERPYAIGKKGAESLGAKILEYENEVYKKFYDDGTPILY